jgi:CRISPR-associated protein Csx3
MKVVLCGSPQLGKSCLREGLKQAICAIVNTQYQSVAPLLYPYVITANPDGEGSWYSATYGANPKRATRLKSSYKSSFTSEFVQTRAKWVNSCSTPLVLIDIGGIPSTENEIICSGASHAIILAKNAQQTLEWQGFCKKLNLVVIAEIISDYEATEDLLPTLSTDGIWHGSIHHLERGESVSERPTIQALANLLIRMAMVEQGTHMKAGQFFKILLKKGVNAADGDLLEVGFGAISAQNDTLVRDVAVRLREMREEGEMKSGSLLKINGPASLPTVITLVHGVENLYKTIAVFDPKLGQYVVVIAEDSMYNVGDLLN